MIWNDDAVADLTRLYEEGKSGSQIGAIMGCSRNAVIGKIDRLGLRPKKTRLELYLERPKKGGKRLKDRPRPRIQSGHTSIDDRYMPYLPPEPVNPEAMKRCTLLQLTSKSCRWPIGDPRERDFHFCGNETAGDGCVYCTHHTRISYTSAADRRADKAATQGDSAYAWKS